jgi:hypothetical protein
MANFVASQLVAAQAKFIKKFQDPEMRRKQNPALVLALKNLSATIPDHMALRLREDRAVNAYLFQTRQPGNGTSRAARPAGAKGNSIQVGLTWQTVAETFAISMKQADNNVFTYQEMLANELMQAVLNIHSRLGTIFLNYLYAHRNQLLLANPQGATADGVNFNYDIAAADNLYFFQKMRSIMDQHYYRGMLDVIGDSLSFMQAQKLRAQGTQNATNLTFQFDNMDIYNTTEQIDANATNGCALAMPAGTFAALPWIPKQNREGHGDYDSYNGGYGVLDDMYGLTVKELDAENNVVDVPMPYGVYAYTQASDDQANNGYYQDQVTTYEISIDFAPTQAPLSGANESVVNEFVQLT